MGDSAGGGDDHSRNHIVYKTFVTNENDLIGHVAYTLYKQDKIKFIEKCRLQKGRAPSKEEIVAFVDGTTLDTRIDSFRTRAETLLRNFAALVLVDEIEEKKNEYKDKLIDELKKQKSLRRAVLENLIASLAATVMMALFVVALYASKVNVPQLIGQIFGYSVQEDKK